ncbi:MAG TPA: hypothetical protein VF121_14790 [Thermoanaerobaculia bacterium]|nr:hypothetical protein [Thermoanaerobaculia bacterium]
MEFSAIDLTQVLVTLISTIGAIVIARAGKKAESAPSRAEEASLTKWHLGMWMCIIVAVVNSGILGWRLISPAPTTKVAITYPVNLARVEQSETVRGTVEGLPSGQVVWVTIFVQEVGRYYPQNRPADIEASGRWSSLVYLGQPADVGKRFDILAAVATTEAQSAFSAYLTDARDRTDFSGLEALPAGALIHDRITVTRK